jgi:anion-transporting  ArsA/GET3 family ATPase
VCPEEEILRAIATASTSFLKFVEIVHLNERIPEQNNILINNLRTDYCTIKEDNKLVLKNKKKIMEEVIDCRISELEVLVDKLKLDRKIGNNEYKMYSYIVGVV